jgi:hypothetical protein
LGEAIQKQSVYNGGQHYSGTRMRSGYYTKHVCAAKKSQREEYQLF